MKIFRDFFAPLDYENFPPCGMFTKAHVISMIITFATVVFLFILTKNISHKKLHKLTRIMAFVMAGLEVLKITYKFYYGYTYVDAWVPLSYCSIFIYSLFFSGYGKGVLKKCADAYIYGGAFLAGLAYIIVPSTSLMDHPIFHFLSFHSMMFHGTMMYFSLMYLHKRHNNVSIRSYLYYESYLLFFSFICITINSFCQSNLMIYRAPFNMPVKFVNDIYNYKPILYTVLVACAYSAIYPFVSLVTWIFRQVYISRNQMQQYEIQEARYENTTTSELNLE